MSNYETKQTDPETLKKLEGKKQNKKGKESDFLKFQSKYNSTKEAEKRNDAIKADADENHKNLTSK
jgi:hypothetical protein